MPMPVTELDDLDSRDLATWVRPLVVDSARADMMLEAAVESVKEAVAPRTTVPTTAKAVVLEAAARAVRPRVQQESLGSRSVSYFAPSDERSGVFLTEDELATLGVFNPGVGVAYMRAPGGAAGGAKGILPGPLDAEPRTTYPLPRLPR